VRTDSLDAGPLGGWLAANGLTLAGGPRLTLIAGGRSNLTYAVADERGVQCVLRRPPHGHVLQSAHDVGREYKIITSLAETEVPVPRGYALCTDESVLGAPFYVMSFVPGTVVAGDEDGAEFPAGSRGRASRELVDVLAAIHQVDVDRVGLGTLGRKQDYCRRQLRRWHTQFHATADGRLGLIDEIHDRLARTVPEQRFTGLVHGDYRPGNVMLDVTGQVNAVLDWELATLGDTLADLGWLLATWRQPGETELLESPSAQDGFWSRIQLVERYELMTGHQVPDLSWYQAFALWRLACISEGIRARYQGGAMGDDGFDSGAEGRHILDLAEASLRALSSGA
jgi:aminoglycoside phosphotransferase (APT) family kinase protein